MSRATFKINSHAAPKTWIDLSPWVVHQPMSKAMHNGSIGQWSVMLSIQPGDPDGEKAIVALQGLIRDDDWAYLDVEGVKLTGLVSDVREMQAADQGGGPVRRIWTVDGADWARCMLATQIRMKSLFACPVTIPEQIEPPPFLSQPDPNLTQNLNEAGGSFAAIPGTAQQTDIISAPAAGIAYPNSIPGFIDERYWGAVIAAIFGKPNDGEETVALQSETADALGNDTLTKAAKAPILNSALAPLKTLFGVILQGLWTDPRGRALLDRIAPLKDKTTAGNPLAERVWPHCSDVPGYSWQLPMIVAQPVICPDQVLRQYLCDAFVEVFYDYGNAADGVSPTEEPAMYVREKRAVFQNSGYFQPSVPVTEIDPGAVIRTDLTRSGAERFNFWQPDAPIVKMPGVTRLIDTGDDKGNHYLPIVDTYDVARHGVRPAEPADTMWPPTQKQNETAMLEWHRKRIQQFYGWYASNPEYLTGTVTLKDAWPTARVGTRVIFPKKTRFQDAGKVIQVDRVEAYVVGWSLDYSVTQPGGAETVTMTLMVTRGQPVGGLSAKPIPAWKVDMAKATPEV